MNKGVLVFLALAGFSVILAGCVSNSNSDGTASLNASLQAKTTENAQLVQDKAALTAELQKTVAQRDAASAQLTVSQQGLAAARNVSRAQLTTVLGVLSANTTAVVSSYNKVNAKYADIINYGCLYYLGGGGYYSNVGNVTIPLGCAVYLFDFVNYTGAYLQVSNSTGSTAAAALITGYLNASS